MYNVHFSSSELEELESTCPSSSPGGREIGSSPNSESLLSSCASSWIKGFGSVVTVDWLCSLACGGGGINLTSNDTILLYYVNSSSISGDTVVERSSLEMVVGDH